jgi:hypothetical protein
VASVHVKKAVQYTCFTGEGPANQHRWNIVGLMVITPQQYIDGQ